MDKRPEFVYGLLVREETVLLTRHGDALGLTGGAFQPLAEDRKVELRAYLADQLGIDARAVWAQGAFDYQHPSQTRSHFSGFYSVWEWTGEVAAGTGAWLGLDEVAASDLPPSLKVLLISVLNTLAVRTR